MKFRKIKDYFREITKSLKEEKSKFRMRIGIKVMLLPLSSYLLFICFLWVLIRINILFFHTNHLLRGVDLNNAYLVHILTGLEHLLPFMIVTLLLNFLVGAYIGQMMMRPFSVLGDYCDSNIGPENSTEGIYDPSFISELKLLSGFSEYFINSMENAYNRNCLEPVIIPKKFTGIHRPIFEKHFFLQYSMIMLITSIISNIIIFHGAVAAHERVIELSIKLFKFESLIAEFFNKQTFLLEEIIIFVIIFNVILLCVITIYLYSMVSTPAFAVFATMRSFLKGSYDARIHLIGYKYLRDECRKINKYLDKAQKQLLS
jgi:hypothetical protein